MATALENCFDSVADSLRTVDIELTKTFRMAGPKEYVFTCDYKDFEDKLASRCLVLAEALTEALVNCGDNRIVYMPLAMNVRAVLNYDCGTIVLNFHVVERTLRVGYVPGE